MTHDLSTPDGLLAHCATLMNSLQDKKISVETAKAQASLVKQSNNLLRYKLDKEKFEHKIMAEAPKHS